MAQTKDEFAANLIRQRLVELRDAIKDAEAEGLTVEVPKEVHLYLAYGTASGASAEWQIRRSY